MKTRDELIAEALSDVKMTNVLPDEPTHEDLMPFSKIRLRKKRMRKKFLKSPFKYVSRRIWREYFAKLMVSPIRRALNYQGIGRQLLMVEELPEGAYARYNDELLQVH
jgi:hypothetical protein